MKYAGDTGKRSCGFKALVTLFVLKKKRCVLNNSNGIDQLPTLRSGWCSCIKRLELLRFLLTGDFSSPSNSQHILNTSQYVWLLKIRLVPALYQYVWLLKIRSVPAPPMIIRFVAQNDLVFIYSSYQISENLSNVSRFAGANFFADWIWTAVILFNSVILFIFIEKSLHQLIALVNKTKLNASERVAVYGSLHFPMNFLRNLI